MDTNGTPASKGKNKHSYYESLDAFLSSSKTALTNAQIPEMETHLKKRGYPAELLAAKRAELDVLQSLDNVQAKERGEKLESTKDYAEAKQKLKTAYNDHLTFARRLFKEDISAKTALALRGERMGINGGYAKQGIQFYKNVLDNQDYLDKLATKGVTREELETGLADFKKLEILAAAQVKESAESQKATSLRDEHWDTLSDWMSEFYETAEIGLRAYPELIKKVGL